MRFLIQKFAMNRAIDYYRNRGYPAKWIEVRLKVILYKKPVGF